MGTDSRRGDGDLRERVHRAVAGPVTEAEKLLAELPDAPVETTLPILVSGWGRGLAAGLEELASAVGAVQHPQADLPQPAQQQPSRVDAADAPQPPSKDSERRDLDEAGVERLTEEARRSREETAEASREADEARRDLGQ
jgi:hypothetical protein